MSTVVKFRSFIDPIAMPIVVLIDMQQEFQDIPLPFSGRGIGDPLAKCRRLLDCARQGGFPIAFVRRIPVAPNGHQIMPPLQWIDGFAPRRDEMVFERSEPSCYASELFARFTDSSEVNLVIAGFAGETACLSTIIDAYHRGHHVTFLADASASHDLRDMSAQEAHHAVSTISRLYGDVRETEDWIATTLPRLVEARAARPETRA